MTPKPRIKLQAVSAQPARSRVDEARIRFGGPFAHEPQTRWKPRAVPVLTEWMQSRGRA